MPGFFSNFDYSPHTSDYAGHHCQNCGAWIPAGGFHSCSPQQGAIKWDRTQEILDAINRLTAAIERLETKLTHQ